MNSSLRRTLYHTHVKCLARDGLLPEVVLKQIPRSNIHRWKSERPDKYRAFEINLHGCDDYNLIREFVKHKTAKRVFSAYVRIIKTVLLLAHSLPGFHKMVKERSKQVVGGRGIRGEGLVKCSLIPPQLILDSADGRSRANANHLYSRHLGKIFEVSEGQILAIARMVRTASQYP